MRYTVTKYGDTIAKYDDLRQALEHADTVTGADVHDDDIDRHGHTLRTWEDLADREES